MPINVEIKARVKDPARTRLVLDLVAGPPVACLIQYDTFFRVPRGRLKLREFGDGSGELIYYERTDVAEPKESRYWIAPISAVAALRTTLMRALGVRGEVRKARRLHSLGRTRIHLDEVSGLGVFLEIEVVLAENQPAREGEETARELLRRLEIPRDCLIADSYIDLLDQSDSTSAAARSGTSSS
jgi:predicted adenylyl cyclase CyaB